RERIECVWKLADSYRFQEKPAPAIARLTPLLALHDKLEDPLGKRDTLRMLSWHRAAQGNYREAEKDLRQALDLHDRHGAADRLTRADLGIELADLLDRQGRTDEAGRQRVRSAQDYRAVLKDPRAGRPGAAGAVTAFWKLQTLYQKGSQY